MKLEGAPVLVALALALALAGCRPSPAATPAVAATPAAVTATRQPAATLTPPTPSPSPTPWLGKLPEGTIALYGAGSERNRRLYALAADGTSTDLGRTVISPAAVSPSGRWLATYDSPDRRRDTAGPARSVVIQDLQEGRVYTVPCTHGCPDLNDYVGAWAFDREESYVAFTETALAKPLYLDLLDLRDGSVRSFYGADELGFPLGWSAAGELVWNNYEGSTEGYFSGGIWGLDLPPDAAVAPMDTVARRPLVLTPWSRGPGISAGGEHLVDWYTDLRLLPDGTRLAFLARDMAYEPADYRPNGYDLALNQLWTLDLASGEPTCLLDVRDGGALDCSADWSPDGREILFVQGQYAGADFWPAALTVWEEGGTVREAGPLPEPGYLLSLDWCAPGTAVVALSVPLEWPGGATPWARLYTVDLASGRAALAAEAPFIEVLGRVE